MTHKRTLKFTKSIAGRTKKVISFILIFTLLFTSLPMDGIVALAEQAIEEANLIKVEKELEQYRTEFTKTYLKSDGTLEAVVSATPIHFKEDGKWVEIDSTLETAENEKGEEVLKNKKGPFSVELPEELQNGSEVKIENGENEISIKLLDTKKSKAKKNKDKKEKAEKVTKAQRKRMTAGELFELDNNQTSAIEYSAVYNDTNIRYDVTPNEVKESIILQKAPNKKAAYSYEITANGLTAVLNEDNSIDFYKGAKAEGATPVFSMPAPYMFDSNNEYSYDIVTTLENKNGKYILTYKPSYEWLKAKERAYPVTVDPTVMVNSGVQAAYTYSAESYKDTYLGYEKQLKVGNSNWQSENDRYYTYLKFTDLPQIPYDDYCIDSAYLLLTPGATGGSWEEIELGVYELTENWKTHKTGSASQRITYNNSPADVRYSTATTTVSRGGADNKIAVGFEIAHIVEKWYNNPETNFGVKLAAHLEEGNNNNHIVFYRETCASGTAPYLSLTYSERIPVERIEITSRPENREWKDEAPCTMSATVYPENATNKDVIWESSNEEVGCFYYIDPDGVAYFEPFSTGATTITARSADNNEVFDSFVLDVDLTKPIAIMGIPTDNKISVGERYEALYSVETTFNNMCNAEWSSSDESIAEVYFDIVKGRVVLIGKSEGVVTIYAKTIEMVPGGTASFDLTVGNLEITNITLEPTSFLDDGILYFGERAVVKARVFPEYFEQHYFDYLDWRASDYEILIPQIIPRDKYRIYISPVCPGTANVWAELDDIISNKLSITVKSPNVEITNLPKNGIAGENTYVLKGGTTHQLGVDLEPTNVKGTVCEWYSRNPNVATVDENGKITTKSEGTTIILYTAKIGGNYSVTDVFTLRVVDIDSVFIYGIPQFDLTVGETYNLTAEVYPYYSFVQGVTWSLERDSVVTSNSVASITSNGKLTLKSVGEVMVFAISKIDNTVFDFEIIEVHPKATSITITNLPTNNSLTVGDTHQLGCVISPTDAFETVNWSSSDTNVISVNSKTGKLTAKKAGIVTITVTTTKTNKKNTKTIEVKPLLIYQTKDIPIFECLPDEEYDEVPYTKVRKQDMFFNDKVLSETYPAQMLIDQWKALCTQVTTEPLQTVGFDMIEHFVGEKTTNFIDSIAIYDSDSKETIEYNIYQNSVLTQKALQHENTVNYLNIVEEQLSLLFESTSRISALKYFGETPSQRKNSVVVQKLLKINAKQPVFDKTLDKVTGLTFCFDSLWGHKMEIVSYENTNNHYSTKVKITFYDHFGLDITDINKYDWPGFNAWYALQHDKRFNGKYKPFISVFSTNIVLTGEIY